MCPPLIQKELLPQGILRITFNRPEKRNALSLSMLDMLEEAVRTPCGGARVLLLQANGPGFCAGADLKERRSMSDDEIKAFLGRLNRLCSAIEDADLPVVGALKGACMGGGLEIALACDLRLCQKDAFFALPETKLGIIPGAGGTYRLPQAVGVAQAKRLILTGDRIDANEAFRIGLVHQLCEDVNAEALAYAEKMAEGAPIAQKLAKRVLNQNALRLREAALSAESAAYAQTLGTKDRLEGLRAFAEKRPPVFQGE